MHGGDKAGVLADHSDDNEMVSLEVTAGKDVAFGYVLRRCGMDAEHADNPENRLRLTVGLRKEDGRCLVAHEHHSFPDTGV
ncbi:MULTISPECIES: hypothetical protein [unclassified Rhodococcus (in: high G+C Gram-positive bacteria)]|uniref:hypothetical protein n=1 Tax=unclassified Rhodococcus (in: high G+C Gram-positive bacteria) TaxID=192944 RepID=UPI0037C69609